MSARRVPVEKTDIYLAAQAEIATLREALEGVKAANASLDELNTRLKRQLDDNETIIGNLRRDLAGAANMLDEIDADKFGPTVAEREAMLRHRAERAESALLSLAYLLAERESATRDGAEIDIGKGAA